jgi:tartrate dehydratase beta subunit/fumarate hydratase class I family protein
LRIELYDNVNALGIGAQGLGGLSTVLDVKILDYPTHATSLPIAMIPNCAATRHAHFTLDGSGVAKLEPPDLARWPDVHWTPSPTAKRVNLDTLTREEVATWQAGDRLLLNGSMLTGRDAAHSASPIMPRAAALPDGVEFTNRVIYYRTGRRSARRGHRSRRPDDGDTDGQVHASDARKHGLLAMIGRRSGTRCDRRDTQHQAAYLMAVGGAAYLLSKAIRGSRLSLGDLGMEAIYEFDVKDMPVTVAVDARGSRCITLRPGNGRRRSARFQSRPSNRRGGAASSVACWTRMRGISRPSMAQTVLYRLMAYQRTLCVAPSPSGVPGSQRRRWPRSAGQGGGLWTKRSLPSVHNLGILFCPAHNERRAAEDAATLNSAGCAPVFLPMTGPTAPPNALIRLTTSVDVLHAIRHDRVHARAFALSAPARTRAVVHRRSAHRLQMMCDADVKAA